MYVVYQHINKITGFVYVGITKHSDNPNRRWRCGHAYYNNGHFFNSIKKHGWDNFEHFCEYVSDRDVACNRERELIKYYKEQGISYNISNGGDGAEAMSEETKEKLRHYTPWIKGRHHTLEVRQKIAEAGRHRKPSAKVLAVFEAARHTRKIVVTEEQKKATQERFGKPVLQIDKKTGEIIAEYPSASAAELAICGRRCGHISEVCLGRPKRHTYCGYKWRYKDGSDK